MNDLILIELLSRLAKAENYLKQEYKLTKHNNHNHKKKMSFFFNKLPINIQSKIFKILNNTERINFMLAYPSYTKEIARSIYWTSFEICLNKNLISLNELRFLLNYLCKSLKGLFIDLCNYQFENIDTDLIELFRKLINVKSLICDASSLPQISTISDCICNNFKSLSSLNISWVFLENRHIIQIVDNLKNLDSIELATNMNISDGLYYLFEHSNSLKKFGIFNPYIADLDELKFAVKCSLSLEQIKLSTENYSNCYLTEFIPCLRSLKVVILENIDNLDRMEGILAQTHGLENLEIKNQQLTNNCLPRLYIYGSEKTIKTLTTKHLVYHNIKLESSLKLLTNLEKLCLDKCIFTEDDLKNSFKKLHNLKSFTYKEILSKPRILSIDFMRNIVEILPDKLEYLEIYMYANTDEEVTELYDALKPLTRIKLIKLKIFINNELVSITQF